MDLERIYLNSCSDEIEYCNYCGATGYLCNYYFEVDECKNCNGKGFVIIKEKQLIKIIKKERNK